MDKLDYILIHKTVYDLKIDDIFKPIVQDILIRRAYVYNFSHADIKNDMDSLTKNLKSIRFSIINESDISGYYMKDKRKIVLSIDYFKRQAEEGNLYAIYETIAHEVTHALCVDKDGYDKLETRIKDGKKTDKNVRSGKINSYLRESWVSELSEHLLKKDRNSYDSETHGYYITSEVTGIIESAFGIRKVDVLRNIAKGRMKLAEFISNQTGKKEISVLNILDDYESIYDEIHRIVYEDKLENIERNSSTYNRFCILNENLYKLGATIINDRMAKFPIRTLYEAKDFCNELKYDFNRCNDLMDRLLSKYDDYGKVKYSKVISIGILDAKLAIFEKIKAMESVLYDEKLNDREKLERFNEIRQMNPMDIKIDNRFDEKYKDIHFPINKNVIRYHEKPEKQIEDTQIIEYMQKHFLRIIDFSHKYINVKRETPDKDKLTLKKVYYDIKMKLVRRLNHFNIKRFWKKTAALPSGSEYIERDQIDATTNFLGRIELPDLTTPTVKKENSLEDKNQQYR